MAMTAATLKQLQTDVANLSAAAAVLQQMLLAKEIDPNLQTAIASSVTVLVNLTSKVVISSSLPTNFPLELPP